MNVERHASHAPRTTPDQETTRWPPGIPFIIGNEAAERFSYYGMRSILVLYMAEVLYAQHPAFRHAPERFAQEHYHLFTAGVYALPLLGAIVADRLLGKYATIMSLSLVYCVGHAVLALFETSVWGLWTGLGLIALGAGGIKPCVSAHMGDQFGKNNWFRLRSAYQMFYFVVNFGSFFSTLIVPWVWRAYGASWAFGIPGLLMGIATLLFWLGRHRFVHVPARPGGKLGLLDAASSIALFMTVGHFFFTAGASIAVWLPTSLGFLALGLALFSWRQRLQPDDGFLAVLVWTLRAKLTPTRGTSAQAGSQPGFFGAARSHFGSEVVEGPIAVLRIVSVFVLVSFFWALFDQHGSSWILQARAMYRPSVFGQPIDAAQVPSLNPVLVMLLIPLMNSVVYPALDRAGVAFTPLRRMTVGMLIASLSFVAVALIQREIGGRGEGVVHIGWQIVPYVLITLAEVLVSVTGLEFAYRQAPRRMKSTIMSFWNLTVSLGNVLVALIAGLAKLPLEQFFWVFAGLMAASAVLFGVRAHFYEPRDYVQS